MNTVNTERIDQTTHSTNSSEENIELRVGNIPATRTGEGRTTG